MGIVKIYFYSLLFFCCYTSIAQQPLTSLPIGGNKRAFIREQVGFTKITITYNRPGVKERQGMIWGKLIPEGFVDLGLSKEPSPWRAGANENTTIEFSTPVTIEGKELPAGKYGFFVAYYPDECILIFSKRNNSWGSFFYKKEEDVLRIKAKMKKLDQSVEWLEYSFKHLTEGSADILLQWEKKMIAFRVETDYLKQQIHIFREELKTGKADMWQSWNQATEWCLENNCNLQEALIWSDSCIAKSVNADSFFTPWGIRAEILDKLGQKEEAKRILQKQLPLAGMPEINNYAMLLLKLKKNNEAFVLLKANYDKYPSQVPAIAGLVYGYAGINDTKNALQYAKKALHISKTYMEKTFIEILIDKLNKGVLHVE